MVRVLRDTRFPRWRLAKLDMVCFGCGGKIWAGTRVWRYWGGQRIHKGVPVKNDVYCNTCARVLMSALYRVVELEQEAKEDALKARQASALNWCI